MLEDFKNYLMQKLLVQEKDTPFYLNGIVLKPKQEDVYGSNIAHIVRKKLISSGLAYSENL